MELPKGLEITWYGHSTFVVQTPNGTRIMIDPWLKDNPACPAALKSDPGPVDVILITHPHFDHVDEADLVPLAKANDSTVVAIIETAGWVRSLGVTNIIEMNIGGTVEIADSRVHMTHAAHSAGIRDGDGYRYGGVATGFVVEAPDGFGIYFAGDTAAFSDMTLIGKLLEPDIAVLPIGDRVTMGPRSAAEAIRMLGVGTVIPFHYDTLPGLTGTPEQLVLETRDIKGLEIIELKPGATLR